MKQSMVFIVSHNLDRNKAKIESFKGVGVLGGTEKRCLETTGNNLCSLRTLVSERYSFSPSV